jgi:ABC-type polysaccharide/polyol phosphate transport system ATPase subunit/ABC-type polysaccharide/polyol phosphate export permease
VSKTFRVPRRRRWTLKERFVDRLRREPDDLLPALQDVAFDIRPGEFFGIVGRNGSGKSTLLRCLAGIYEADRGSVEVDGRLSPFVELGVGFNIELSGRDNVMVNGVMLGLSRRQVRERFDDILAFAELQEFADQQLKNYSSGMSVRLAFSVAIQVDADVLLIDEVLAVGDSSFQAKCFEEFERLRAAGRTIVLVTHDMDAVERFCDRAMLLEQGRVVDIGEPSSIVAQYEEVNRSSSERRRPAPVEHLPDRRAARRAQRERRRSALADGPRRYRPTAFGGELRRLAELTFTVAALSLKVHYLGSKLGYLWGVARPLTLFGVIYFVFSNVGGFSDGVEHYAVYLLTSLVLWTYFAEATTGSASSLLDAQSLLRNLRFPRVVIPLAAVLKALFSLAMNSIAVVILLAASGVSPRLSWLELPLLVALLVVLATGIAMLLSSLYIRFRDVAQLWQLAVQLLLFGSGVFYVITEFSRGVQQALVANPLAMTFTEMRHALIDPSAPSAAEIAGGPGYLAIPLAVVAGTFCLGLWVFRRESPLLAESM